MCSPIPPQPGYLVQTFKNYIFMALMCGFQTAEFIQWRVFSLIQPVDANHLILSKAWLCTSSKTLLLTSKPKSIDPCFQADGVPHEVVQWRYQPWGMGKGDINSEQGNPEIPGESGIEAWPSRWTGLWQLMMLKRREEQCSCQFMGDGSVWIKLQWHLSMNCFGPLK